MLKVEQFRVLDGLMQQNVEPSVVIGHLRQYEPFAVDIVKRSYCMHRIVSLDFFLRCSEAEKTCLFDNVILKLSFNEACYFFWQCMHRSSSISCEWRAKIRQQLSISFAEGRNPRSLMHQQWPAVTQHPYSSYLSKLAETVDDYIFMHLSEGYEFEAVVVKMLSRLKDVAFNELDLMYSLFAPRFLQLDTFECLSPDQQYVFINSIKTFSEKVAPSLSACRTKLLKQVLDSCSNNAVKEHVIKELIEDRFDTQRDFYGNEQSYVIPSFSGTDTSNSKLSEKISQLDCFEELILEQSLHFNEVDKVDWSDIMLEMLLLKRYDVLVEWVEYDRSQFDSIMNMSTLVEAFARKKLKRQRKKAKATK